MLKQAGDLCESQYQLNLILANGKVPASSVWDIESLRIEKHGLNQRFTHKIQLKDVVGDKNREFSQNEITDFLSENVDTIFPVLLYEYKLFY